MQHLRFPIDFTFKISTLSNDFTATDADGRTVAYVRQKLFKFKDEIVIYGDTEKTRINYTIKADRWLDFSAAYTFYDQDDTPFGKVVRKGWRSIWRAEYELIDQHDQPQYRIREENAWVKVLDNLLGGVPVLGAFTGYFFNPAYLVTNQNDEGIVRLKKQSSLFGRRFQVTKLSSLDNDDDDRIMLGLMMMILLERERG